MKKKLTEEDRELLLEQETDEQTACEEAAEFDSSFDVTPASAEETDKPAKPIIEYLTPEDRKRRGRDRCILRIPTPTCSDGSAPTIMATGYASATTRTSTLSAISRSSPSSRSGTTSPTKPGRKTKTHCTERL